MKKKKLLVAGGMAVAGGLLIYFGYKYVVKQQTTTEPEKKSLTQVKVTDTWTRGTTSTDPAVSDRLKSLVKQPVSGLGNAFLLN
jgi:hypothetical protein